MPSWLEKSALVVLLCGLLACASHPLWWSDLTGPELALLARSDRAERALAEIREERGVDLTALTRGALSGWTSVDAGGGAWLTGAWTQASRSTWRALGIGGAGATGASGPTGGPGGTGGTRETAGAGPIGGEDATLALARALRAEQVALLAIAAACWAAFARRLLLPWLGAEHAAAAAQAMGLAFALHPVALPAAFGLTARGELLSLALAGACAAAFLRGRQDRRSGWTALSFCLALLAGSSGSSAAALPLVLGAAEFASARRYQLRRERWRTTGVTVVVFAAAVLLEPIVRAVALGGADFPGAWLAGVARGEVGAYAVLQGFGSRLGALVLPSTPHAAAEIGLVAAGVLVLVALRPFLVAARAAPRLWGRFVASWALCTAAIELAAGPIAVTPGDLTRAPSLFPACAASALFLGTAATALSGWRRWATPAALAIGYAVLASANGRPWIEAGRAVREIRTVLSEAELLYGADPRYLVVDAPARVSAVDAAGDDLSALGRGGARVQGVSSGALLAALTSAGDRAVAPGDWVVIVPRRAIDPAGLAEGHAIVRMAARAEGGEGAAERPRSLPPPWRVDSRSPDLALDPLAADGLRVVAPSDANTAVRPTLRWRAAEASIGVGGVVGTWLPGTALPTAVFDLSSSLAWCLSGEVRRVWIEGAPARIERAEFLARLPDAGQGVAPSASGADWVAEGLAPEPAASSGASGTSAAGAAGAPGAAGAEGAAARETRLVLVNARTLSGQSIAAIDGVGPGEAGASLVFPGAEAAARDLSGGRDELAWSIERRVDGVAVARTSGRWKPPAP